MFRSKIVIVLSLLLGVNLGSRAVQAAIVPTFTVTVASAFLRDSPSLSAPRTYSVFEGQAFGVVGRTADNAWLRLDFAGAVHGTWVPAVLGSVTGSLTVVPVTAAAPVTTTETSSASLDAIGTPLPKTPGRARLTITVKSLYGLSSPSFIGVRVESLFQGQTYTVLAQSANGQWLRVLFGGATTDVWVPSTMGTVVGDVASIPIEEATAAEAATPTPGLETPAPPVTNTLDLITQTLSLTSTEPLSSSIGLSDYPIVPEVSAHAREIYQQGLAMGNDPHAFSKIGDCQNVTAFFLANFDHPKQYRLGADYAALQSTIDQFHGSFSRPSEAVRGGFNVASVLDPMWTNPSHCKPKETPLDCEFRVHKPSIVFISMETWWADAPAAQYEASLRKIVEYAIARGAVPILATKADNLEKNGGINAAIVRVAKDYDVPLWNFWLAAQPLPAHGLTGDGFHLTIGPEGQFIFDDAENMRSAWPWRNLTALQALDAVWQAVK